MVGGVNKSNAAAVKERRRESKSLSVNNLEFLLDAEMLKYCRSAQKKNPQLRTKIIAKCSLALMLYWLGISGPFILRPLPNELPGHTKGRRAGGGGGITSRVRSQREVLPAVDLQSPRYAQTWRFSPVIFQYVSMQECLQCYTPTALRYKAPRYITGVYLKHHINTHL